MPRMRASPQGTALRLRPPSWRDPRLAIGIALVLSSVVIGALVVAGADDTVAVYAADGALVPGDTLDRDSLTVVRVRLDDAARRYVTAEQALAPGAVAQRAVGDGELLPRSAVGDAADLTRRPVTVPVTGPRPPGLERGSLVDVWIATDNGQGTFAPPVKVLAGAEVADVAEAGGGLAAVTSTGVSILLDDAGTAQVLGALANGDRVDVVVVPGTAARG